jgi:copper homeostasis protein CutC
MIRWTGTHTRELIELARPLQVTFHRAFDACRDLDAALEDVIACGADRLLTGGDRSDAVNGLDTIAGLRQRAAGRIRIMAGGGIRIGNVREIALRTGIRDVHTSLSTKVICDVCDGGADGSDLQGRSACYVVKESDMREFKSVLRAITTGARAHVQ